MIKRIITYIPSVFVPMVLNFILVFIYADVLTPNEYGILNIYLNTISFVYAIVLSFLQSASYRFFSSDEGKDKEVYMSTYIISNIVISVLAGGILWLGNLLIFKFNWWIIACAIFINALYQFFLNLSRLENKVKKFTVFRIATVVISLGVLVTIKLLGQSVSYIVPILAVYGAYLIVVLWEIVKILKDINITKFSFALLKESARYGMPMMGYSIAGLLLAYCDQYIILYFLDETQVGYYSLGHRLADTVVTNVTSMLLLVITPVLMRMFDEGKKKECEHLLTAELNLNFWITVPLVSFLVIYADVLINLFFPAYQNSVQIVQWVVIAGFFHAFTTIACKSLELQKETKLEFLFVLISAIINFVYNIIFIPIYGTLAAAHSSIIAYLVNSLLLIIASKRFVKINMDYKYLLKIIVVTGMTIFIAIFLKQYWKIASIISFAIQGVVLVIIYLGLSFIGKMQKGFVMKL